VEHLIQPVVFWRLFESELQIFISKAFKDAGRQIDSYAISRIIALMGRDLKKIEDSVERILTGSDGPVSEKTVVAFLADEKEATVFEFTEAFFKRSADCLVLLKKVIDEGGSELGIISLLLREAERIEKYHELRLSGKNHDDVLSELKINPRSAEDFISEIRTTDLKRVRILIELLAQADREIKSFHSSSSLMSRPLSGLIAEYFSETRGHK